MVVCSASRGGNEVGEVGDWLRQAFHLSVLEPFRSVPRVTSV